MMCLASFPVFTIKIVSESEGLGDTLAEIEALGLTLGDEVEELGLTLADSDGDILGDSEILGE